MLGSVPQCSIAIFSLGLSSRGAGYGACFMSEGEEVEEVLENIALCPTCDEEVGHIILRTKGRGKGVDHLVQCVVCDGVHTVELRPPKSTEVRFTLSEGSDSRQTVIEVDIDEKFSMGDEFDHDDAVWKITRLELPDATSSKHVSANEVNMVWATRCDLVVVRLTFTEGELSFSDRIICEPNQEFKCGTIYLHNGERWRIRALHSGRGRTLNGSMKAGNIRRIFLHLPPDYEEAKEKRIRERGRWRGQEFEGREEHQQKVREANIRKKIRNEDD